MVQRPRPHLIKTRIYNLGGQRVKELATTLLENDLKLMNDKKNTGKTKKVNKADGCTKLNKDCTGLQTS